MRNGRMAAKVCFSPIDSSAVAGVIFAIIICCENCDAMCE